jgi:hypothetical protein
MREPGGLLPGPPAPAPAQSRRWSLRSGRPAVVFHIEENRRADGVHIVDPYTTRCPDSRS